MNPTNPDLLALQSGEEAALERLIARWKKPLFAFAWRYLRNTADANDLVAEVFVRLYQRRDRLGADANLSAWLFTILANLCHNHCRWRKRHPAVSLEAPAGPGENEGTLAGSIAVDQAAPDAELEHREAHAALAAAIERLPHDLKVTLLLHHYERLGYAEIANVVGCSTRGVETRLYRARQFLRAELTPFLRETRPE